MVTSSLRKKNPLPRKAARHIAIRARQACRRAPFTVSDIPDVAQELTAHALAQVRHYDPARGPLTRFLVRGVDRKLISLQRFYVAAKRDRRLERRIPFDELQDPAGGPPRVVDLVRDVRGFLDDLPADMRAVADHLADGSELGASRALGFSRRRVSDLARDLRTRFRLSGLEEHLS